MTADRIVPHIASVRSLIFVAMGMICLTNGLLYGPLGNTPDSKLPFGLDALGGILGNIWPFGLVWGITGIALIWCGVKKIRGRWWMIGMIILCAFWGVAYLATWMDAGYTGTGWVTAVRYVAFMVVIFAGFRLDPLPPRKGIWYLTSPVNKKRGA